MTATIPDTLLTELSDFVAARLGLNFPPERWPDLERGARAASQENGDLDFDGYIQRVLSSTLSCGEIEILGSHLTVGETYFFRERRSLEILEDHLLSALTGARRSGDRQLRIWSAGCATGEEPYSIAILLGKMILELKDWNITILATDLNTRLLQKASEGVYRDWSFRGTPDWVRSRYFTATSDGCWTIAPSIKKMVRFAYLNLMEDVYPSLLNATNAMDVIFCRNVLMYFTPEAMERVVHRLYRSLADGGWLIVSPTETSHTLFSEFVTVRFTDATLYRKASRQAETLLPLQLGGQNEGAPSTQPPRATIGCQEPAETQAPQLDQKPSAGSGEPTRAGSRAISYAEALRLYEQGHQEDSQEMVVALLSQDRDDEQAMLLLARLYANQGKLQEAFRWCEKAIAMNKTDARVHYLQAAILQEQGLLEEAALSLRRTLYTDPQFVLGHFALGNLVLRQGKLKESEKHFENTLALLARHQQDDILPESEGLTAGRLRDLIALERARGGGAPPRRQRAAHAPSSHAVPNPGKALPR